MSLVRRPGEVVVRVGSVGICGTDLSIHAGNIAVDYPRVMGHEIVGTVVSGGSDDEASTRVLVDPGFVCGDCLQCREGRTNICTAGGLIGRDRDGGLRDLMTVPASNIHELPDELDTGTAPMLQVLATCVHAQRRSPGLPGRERRRARSRRDRTAPPTAREARRRRPRGRRHEVCAEARAGARARRGPHDRQRTDPRPRKSPLPCPGAPTS